ncbi:hypothetical protein, partial [Streptomyces otsuchiensis]|uniref:hypothetical protein n=1 Tax=Streptomyces otsuchiensis TaxID=2681388 RepID=UPI001D130CBE
EESRAVLRPPETIERLGATLLLGDPPTTRPRAGRRTAVSVTREKDDPARTGSAARTGRGATRPAPSATVTGAWCAG